MTKPRATWVLWFNENCCTEKDAIKWVKVIEIRALKESVFSPAGMLRRYMRDTTGFHPDDYRILPSGRKPK